MSALLNGLIKEFDLYSNTTNTLTKIEYDRLTKLGLTDSEIEVILDDVANKFELYVSERINEL